jgi:uncharacterized caspase-like protein
MKQSVIALSGLLFIFLNLSGCNLPMKNGNDSLSKEISGDTTENVSQTERFTNVPMNSLKELSAENSNRIALVIGNGDYERQALPNPIYDAQDISNTLNRLGFSVIQVLNADKATMNQAIQKFRDDLDDDKVGLLYYSGHGVQHDGKNYMIPIEAMLTIDEPSDLNTDAVSMTGVLSKMENAKNRLNMVFLDACRDNPFDGFSKGDRKAGLALVGSAERMLIAYATAPNKAALITKERNSPYTKYLLHYMEQDLPIELMLKQVRVAVKNETDGEQTPWYAVSIAGRFTFANPKHRSEQSYGTTTQGGIK